MNGTVENPRVAAIKRVERRIMRKIRASYPRCQIIGITEIYVRSVGWYHVLIDNKETALRLIIRGLDSSGRPIENYNIHLLDRFGATHLADFSSREFVKKRRRRNFTKETK